MNANHYCPLCPASFPYFDRLLYHIGLHGVDQGESDSDLSADDMEIERVLAEDAIEEISGTLENMETEPVCKAWTQEQNVLLRLLSLHRLGHVSRFAMHEMIDIQKEVQQMDTEVSIRKILRFERDFQNDRYCITPSGRNVESTCFGFKRTFKIGYIPISKHIARVYQIKEVSRKLQLWKSSVSQDDQCFDLYDLPCFKTNPLMLEDKRNLLLIFYVDQITRNRQVNTQWKNVWVLRCIPAQLPMQERANMENWWDLTFVPGFLLKEKGVNYFLEPFVDELLQLRQQGVEVYDAVSETHFRCKADYFGIIGDLPGVAKTVYFKEGGYSKLLRWCMHCWGLQGDVFSAPPRVNAKNACVLVEWVKMYCPANEASFHATYNGVNGCSALWKLDSFNTNTIFNDFFHTILEGELKKITYELFRKNTNQTQYSIFLDSDLKMINAIIGSLPLRTDDEKMVDFVRRFPFYSGHQMFLWLRVALPVLHRYLPKSNCNCRQQIRTKIPADLREFFGLEKDHTYYDHFVGLREFCKLFLPLTSHHSFTLSDEDMQKTTDRIQKITQLHIHLYGKSFVTVKTHMTACHMIELIRYQGKPGWLHCFTPERDNRSVKTLNINSTNVFYNLLKLSKINKAVELCRSSSNDSKIAGKGYGIYKPLDRRMIDLFDGAYRYWGIEQPVVDNFAVQYNAIVMPHFDLKRDSFFLVLRPNNTYDVGRLLTVLYYGAMYWILMRIYIVDDEEPDDEVGLYKLKIQPNENLVPASRITQQVIVLPGDPEFFMRQSHNFTTCERTQQYYYLLATNVTELSFHSITFYDEERLLESVFKRLTKLELIKCNFTAISGFEDLLESATNLTSLSVASIDIKDDQKIMRPIISLKNNLQELSLDGIHSIELANGIADLLDKNKTLKKLTFHNCFIDEKGCKDIMKALDKNTTLTHLSFTNEQLTAESLGQFLQTNGSLKVLELRNCLKIDLTEISEALKVNTSLTELHIQRESTERIKKEQRYPDGDLPKDYESLMKFIEALRVNRTLRALSFDFEGPFEWRDELLKSLHTNPSLRDMCICPILPYIEDYFGYRHEPAGDKLYDDLMELLKQNIGLKRPRYFVHDDYGNRDLIRSPLLIEQLHKNVEIKQARINQAVSVMKMAVLRPNLVGTHLPLEVWRMIFSFFNDPAIDMDFADLFYKVVDQMNK